MPDTPGIPAAHLIQAFPMNRNTRSKPCKEFTLQTSNIAAEFGNIGSGLNSTSRSEVSWRSRLDTQGLQRQEQNVAAHTSKRHLRPRDRDHQLFRATCASDVPGNIIPANRIDPTAAKIQPMSPAPTLATHW
jgi:hypothetical protein